MQLKGWAYGAMSINNAICKSGNILGNGDAPDTTYWCMTATTNTEDVTKGLDTGAKCATKEFVNTAEPTTESAGETVAKCGFNQDAMAYCPLQTGDALVQDPMASAVASWNAKRTECPSGGNAMMCAKWSSEDKENIATYSLHSSLVYATQGWPNVANNADCVKDTYTSWFHGSNAASLGVASVFAALSIMF